MPKTELTLSAGYEALKKNISAINNSCIQVQVGTIGRSVLERSLFSIGFGNSKNAALFVGGVHGLEWITTLLLIKFAKKLCCLFQTGGSIAGENIQDFFGEYGLCIIPCLNPDGIEIALYGSKSAGHLRDMVEKICRGDFSDWQANARGVDLNHNFDAGWGLLRQLEQRAGIIGPSPRRYGGTGPESEPETKALCRFCRANNFNKAFAFHSQGREIYWNYGSKTPRESRYIAELFAKSSGYMLSQPEGLAQYGGFKDWFIEYFEKPGFTIEVGKGKNPLPISQLDEIYNDLEEAMLLAIHA